MTRSARSGKGFLLSGLRGQLGHLKLLAREYARPRKVRHQLHVIRHLTLPPIPRHRGERTAIWGITVVRDEADILPITLEHLRAQGVTHVLIADHGSRDGTREFLDDLSSRTEHVYIATDSTKAHFQSEKMTYLAHVAWRHGARWVIPFDADELWFSMRGSLREHLTGAREDAVVQADFHHMVPVTANEIGPASMFVMDTTPSFPGKVAVRSHPFAYMYPGNHAAHRPGTLGTGLAIAHAQYRGPEQVARKVRQGTESSRLTGEDLSWFSPHWVAGSRLSDEAISEAFTAMTEGKPVPALQWKAAGPMVRVAPRTWSTWDPDGTVRAAREEREVQLEQETSGGRPLAKRASDEAQ